VVSFTPGPLYPQGKSPSYPLDRRLGGPQSRSGRGRRRFEGSLKMNLKEIGDGSLEWIHLAQDRNQ
jgi:hypothetical protein